VTPLRVIPLKVKYVDEYESIFKNALDHEWWFLLAKSLATEKTHATAPLN
jgi:hypothetical protein